MSHEDEHDGLDDMIAKPKADADQRALASQRGHYAVKIIIDGDPIREASIGLDFTMHPKSPMAKFLLDNIGNIVIREPAVVD